MQESDDTILTSIRGSKLVRNMVAFVVFVLVFIVSYQGVFVLEGNIGHKWDWGIPDFPEQIEAEVIKKAYVWNDSYYTGRSFFSNSEILYWQLLFFIAELGISNIAVVVIFIIHLTSFISMNHFLRRYFGLEEAVTVFIGLFYAFTPYVYSRVIAGHLTMLFGYSILPTLFYQSLRYFEAKRVNYFNLFFLVLFSILTSLHLVSHILFYIVLGIAVISSFIRSRELKIFTSKLPVVVVTLLLTNIYWFSNQAYSVYRGSLNIRPDKNIVSEVADRKNYLELNASRMLSEVLTSTVRPGLDTESIYAKDPYTRLAVVFSSILLLSALFYPLIGKSKIRRQEIYFFLLSLLFLWISVGYKTFIGEYIYSALNLIPVVFSTGFSNPLRWLPIFYLFFSISVALVLGSLLSNESRRKKLILPAFFLILLSYLTPWWNGSITDPVDKSFIQTLALHVDSISNEDSVLFEQYRAVDGDFRVAILPPSLVSWPGNTAHAFAWNSTFFPKPTFLQSADHPLGGILIKALYGKVDYAGFPKLLSLASVKDIIYPDYPFYGSYKTFIPWVINYKDIVDPKIYTNSSFILKDSFNTIDIFELKEFTPHIFTPNYRYNILGSLDGYLDVASLGDFNTSSVSIFGDFENPSFNSVYAVGDLKQSILSFTDFFWDGGWAWPQVNTIPGTLKYRLVLLKEKLIESGGDSPLSDIDILLWHSVKRAEELNIANIPEHFKEDIVKRYRIKLIEVMDSFKEYPKDGKDANYWDQLRKTIMYTDRASSILSRNENVPGAVDALLTYQEFIDWAYYDSTFNCLGYCFSIVVPESGNYELFISNNIFDAVEGSDLKISIKEGLGTFEDVFTPIISSSNKQGHLHKTINIYLEKGIDYTLSFETSPSTNFLSEGDWEFENAQSSNGDGLDLSNQFVFPNFDIIKNTSDEELVESNPLYLSNIYPHFKEINKWEATEEYKISFDFSTKNGTLGVALVEELPDFDFSKDSIEDLSSQNLTYTKKVRFEQLLSRNSLFLGRFSDTGLSNCSYKEDGNCFIHFETSLTARQYAGEAYLYFYNAPNKSKFSTVSVRNVKVEKVQHPSLIARKINSTVPFRTPALSFNKLDPTRYTVEVDKAFSPYTLVFNESFSKDWKIYLKTSESTKEISLDKHYKANGYANAWDISPSDVSGLSNYNLLIEYWPQKLYDIGIVISVITVIVSFIVGIGQEIYRKMKK